MAYLKSPCAGDVFSLPKSRYTKGEAWDLCLTYGSKHGVPPNAWRANHDPRGAGEGHYRWVLASPAPGREALVSAGGPSLPAQSESAAGDLYLRIFAKTNIELSVPQWIAYKRAGGGRYFAHRGRRA